MSPAERAPSRSRRLLQRSWPALAGLLAACATAAPPSTTAGSSASPEDVLGRTAAVVVVRAGAGDTAEEIARRHLGDPGQAWRVAVLGGGPVRPGAVAAVPVKPGDPGAAAGARYIPVLCYHRFTAGRSTSAMEVGAENLDAQLRWLRDGGYTVAPLSEVVAFMAGRRALPPKTVAITIDDGYRSALTVALPVLKRYGDPATLFVYTDFIGSREGLSYADLAGLKGEPLISVQSHSKTHRDMVKHLPGETPAAYAARRRQEVSAPQAVFSSRSSFTPDIFAYPFGSADLGAVALVEHEGFKAAFTVARGGNPPWSAPFLLRRDMIYGSDDLATFARRIQAAERGSVDGPRETEQ